MPRRASSWARIPWAPAILCLRAQGCEYAAHCHIGIPCYAIRTSSDNLLCLIQRIQFRNSFAKNMWHSHWSDELLAIIHRSRSVLIPTGKRAENQFINLQGRRSTCVAQLCMPLIVVAVPTVIEHSTTIGYMSAGTMYVPGQYAEANKVWIIPNRKL